MNAWKTLLQGVVENLAYIRRLTKNAARHRYGKHVRGSTRREATQDDGGEPSQFGGGIGEEVAGDGIALIGGAEDDRKQARKIRRRCRIGLLYKFVDGGELPRLQKHRGQRGIEPLIARVHDRGDGVAANPVSGTLVGDGEPPASGARGLAASIAAVNDGTSTGNRDHTRASAERGFQGDYGIADNFDFCRIDFRNQFGDDVANLGGDFGPSRARSAYTDRSDPVGGNFRAGADLADGSLQSFPGLRFADANQVAPAGHRRSERRRLVGENAAGFGAAAVDSEIVQNYFSPNTFAYCCTRSLANCSSVSVCSSAALASVSICDSSSLFRFERLPFESRLASHFCRSSHFPKVLCCCVKNSS